MTDRVILAAIVALCLQACAASHTPPTVATETVSHETKLGANENLVYLDVPESASVGEVEVGQDVCFLGVTVPEGLPGAGYYSCPCGGIDHGSNPVWQSLWEATLARNEALGWHKGFQMAIGVQGDEIHAVRWSTKEEQ